MAKQGMSRIERTHTKPKNDVPPVTEIQGKAKHGKTHANPIIAGTEAPSMKVYHGIPHSKEKKVDSPYSVFDTDLATDNLVNDYDLSDADLQDLKNWH